MSHPSKCMFKKEKTVKESSAISSKSTNHVNTGAGVPSSGYNPLSGTFHTVHTPPVSTPRVQVTGRYQTIEETDDRSSNNLFGAGVECDAISNNESWCGEPEDHRDKSSRQEAAVPGSNIDKRNKIRLMNEKKHQCQKERRAQELHERCCGYLTSRKLKALSQQLVSMGFSQERATMALIHNEGKVEESVAWIFEGGEEETDTTTKQQNLDTGSKKIDISEELDRVAEMVIRCKCSRQEVERAVVACEGDLEKAEESLQREDPPFIPPKPDGTDDPLVASNPNSMSIQQKTAPVATTQQQQRNGRDFNYTKLVGRTAHTQQSTETIQPKLEWARPLYISELSSEKRCSVATSSPSSMSPALQVWPVSVSAQQPTKSESGYVVSGSELKNQLPVSTREPSSVTGKMASGTNVGQSIVGKMASDTTAMGWSTNNSEILKPNDFIPVVSETRTIHSGGRNPFYNQFPSSQGGRTLDSVGPSRVDIGSLSRSNASPKISVASSLGFFSGFGAPGWNSDSSVVDYSNIDWNLNGGGGDDSGDGSFMSRKPNGGGLWPGTMNPPPSSMQYNTGTYNSNDSIMQYNTPTYNRYRSNGPSDMQYDTRTYDTYRLNIGSVRPPLLPPHSMLRTADTMSRGGGSNHQLRLQDVVIGGGGGGSNHQLRLQDVVIGGGGMGGVRLPLPPSHSRDGSSYYQLGLQGGGGGGGGGGVYRDNSGEWGSPFEEIDLFSLQRNSDYSYSVQQLEESLKRMKR